MFHLLLWIGCKSGLHDLWGVLVCLQEIGAGADDPLGDPDDVRLRVQLPDDGRSEFIGQGIREQPLDGLIDPIQIRAVHPGETCIMFR